MAPLNTRHCFLFVVGWCATAAAPVSAQLSNKGVLDSTLEHFEVAAGQWTDVAQRAAEQLFWSLAAVSLLWTGIQLLLNRAELGDIARELCQFMMLTGFWAWMMRNGPRHAGIIIETMVDIGGKMSGTSTVRTPSGIYDLGFVLFERINDASRRLGIGEAILAKLAGLIILLLLAYVAALMLQVLIAGWLVAYGGVFVLGFGGAKWTSDIAMNYYRLCLGLGLQAMATVLLVGAGQSLVEQFAESTLAGMRMHEVAVLLTVSCMLVVVVGKVPPQVAALATGGGVMHGLSSLPTPGLREIRHAVGAVFWLARNMPRSRGRWDGNGGGGSPLGTSPSGGAPGASTGGTPLSQVALQEYTKGAFERGQGAPGARNDDAGNAGPVAGAVSAAPPNRQSGAAGNSREALGNQSPAGLPRPAGGKPKSTGAQEQRTKQSASANRSGVAWPSDDRAVASRDEGARVQGGQHEFDGEVPVPADEDVWMPAWLDDMADTPHGAPVNYTPTVSGGPGVAPGQEQGASMTTGSHGPTGSAASMSAESMTPGQPGVGTRPVGGPGGAYTGPRPPVPGSMQTRNSGQAGRPEGLPHGQVVLDRDPSTYRVTPAAGAGDHSVAKHGARTSEVGGTYVAGRSPQPKNMRVEVDAFVKRDRNRDGEP